MNDDAQIIENLIGGNKFAFESIYNEYSKELYYYALGFLRNNEVAEDLVQEAFVYLWRNRQNILPHYPISIYLKKIVKNSCLNYFRHLKVEKKHENEFVSEQIFNNVDRDELHTLIIKVRTIVNRLPDKCRRIFVLTCVEGLKYNEVAEDMGISVNTVKSQVKIAYKKIRSEVKCSEPELFAIFILFEMSVL